MKAKTYLAELKSDLTKYDQMGLIDEVSVYTWIEDAMKKFGKLVCVKTDAVLDVQKGEACLPRDFYRLHAAYRVEPIGYSAPKGEDISDLQQEFAWTERTERGFRWNSCEECCKEEFECVITERFYIKTSARIGEVDFHYHGPRLLNLGKSIRRKACSEGFRFDERNPDSIEIDQTRLFANFDTGSIYMTYWATPRDEEGLPYIFDSELGFLHQFVDTYVKRKIFEKLFTNGDDPNVVTRLQYYMAQEPLLERKAMGELKMAGLSPESYYKMARESRSKLEIYGRMFPKL